MSPDARGDSLLGVSSAVLDLQRDALDSRVEVTALLRRALVVAKKLGLEEFVEWTTHELDGYPEKSTFPEYRFAEGEVKAFNPYHGWVPVVFENPKLARAASRRPTAQTVAEIEAQLSRTKPGAQLMMPFPKEGERQLQRDMGVDFPIGTFIDPSSLDRVLNGVRNTVLNWTLKLESDGILGEGLVFSAEEKAAASAARYAVNNFWGDASGIQIQQFSDSSTQEQVYSANDLRDLREFLSALHREFDGLPLGGEPKEELKAEMATLEAQQGSPRPKLAIIRQGLSSIRRIRESAVGSAGGKILLDQLQNLLR